MVNEPSIRLCGHISTENTESEANRPAVCLRLLYNKTSEFQFPRNSLSALSARLRVKINQELVFSSVSIIL